MSIPKQTFMVSPIHAQLQLNRPRLANHSQVCLILKTSTSHSDTTSSLPLFFLPSLERRLTLQIIYCVMLTVAQWRNPRATLVSFITAVLTIFAFRYLNIARWVFKATYVALGGSCHKPP